MPFGIRISGSTGVYAHQINGHYSLDRDKFLRSGLPSFSRNHRCSTRLTMSVEGNWKVEVRGRILCKTSQEGVISSSAGASILKNLKVGSDVAKNVEILHRILNETNHTERQRIADTIDRLKGEAPSCPFGS